MGLVELDCIASSPDSTILYGIGNAETILGEVVTVLYRSNINPANVTDITWVEQDRTSGGSFDEPITQPHFKYSRFGGVDCAVSTSGDFTAFFYNPEFAVTGMAKPVPMGIQFYRDRTERTLEIYGWTMYGWTNQNFSHQSFYIEKDGVETVVHAVMDETASVIRFGLVHKNTGYLQLAAVWKLADGRFMVGELTDKFPKLPNPIPTSFAVQYYPAPSINTDQRHMVYQNGSLYLYSDTTGLISTFPFSSPFTTPTQKDYFQATPIPTNKRNMFFQGMRQNSSYLGYLARVDNLTDFSLKDNIPMQLSTIDLSINLTTSPAAKGTTRDVKMNLYGDYKEVIYLQAIGGQLPRQVPFAVGLTVSGYYGITLDGPSMGSMIPSESRSSTIEGVLDRSLRSRFRNHDGQVVPGYKRSYSYPVDLSSTQVIGVVLGAIFGFFFLSYPISIVNRWLKKARLTDEGRAVERESIELIARLRHVSGHHNSDSSSTSTAIGGGGSGGGGGRARGFPFDSTSANTTSHTLLSDLGLTRHPRPNTVITIGDDVDDSAQGRVNVNTQQ